MRVTICVFLALFLFVASFSFIGCDGDDGANGITGPTGMDGADGVGLPDGYHFDINADDIVRACPDGYHAHEEGRCEDVNTCNPDEIYTKVTGMPENELDLWICLPRIN